MGKSHEIRRLTPQQMHVPTTVPICRGSFTCFKKAQAIFQKNASTTAGTCTPIELESGVSKMVKGERQLRNIAKTAVKVGQPKIVDSRAQNPWQTAPSSNTGRARSSGTRSQKKTERIPTKM